MSTVIDTLSDMFLSILDMILVRESNKRGRRKEGHHDDKK